MTMVLAAQRPAPIPSGYAPEGVPETRFDASLLSFIDYAIPRGMRVFSHLLYYATMDPRTTMQQSLFQATGDYGDEAIVLIHSIEALARTEHSPCAPETYHKVLLAMEAMQIIRRRFHRTYTEIRIPLGKRTIHIPTLLQGLQQMYQKHGNAKGTNKFQRFACRVAARLTSGEFAQFDTFPGKGMVEHQEIAQVLVHLLETHNVKEVRVPSLQEACELIVTAVRTGRVRHTSGELPARSQVGARTAATEPGESSVQSGEFAERVPQDDAGDSLCRGEFISTNSPDCAFAAPTAGKKQGRTRAFRVKKGELETVFATNSPEWVDLRRFSADLGESFTTVSLSDHISSEDISCNGDTTLNDEPLKDSPAYRDPRPIDAIRHEAADLAERLDGSRQSRWLAKLISCVQSFPASVRRLAEIDTLYHSAFPDYRGKPKVPGAWFTRRCEEYANPSWKVKDEIRQWDRSGMDLLAIHQELQRGRPTPSSLTLPFDPLPEEVAAEEREDTLGIQAQGGSRWDGVVAQEERQEVQHHSLLRTRMDQQQALTLCQQIHREWRVFGEQLRQVGFAPQFQAEVYQTEDPGEYVVVTVWDGNEEEWVNASEWNRYFERVKKCYE